jgi:hypothetical protein
VYLLIFIIWKEILRIFPGAKIHNKKICASPEKNCKIIRNLMPALLPLSLGRGGRGVRHFIITGEGSGG